MVLLDDFYQLRWGDEPPVTYDTIEEAEEEIQTLVYYRRLATIFDMETGKIVEDYMGGVV